MRFGPNLWVSDLCEREEIDESDQDDDLVRAQQKGAAATERSEDEALARGRRFSERRDDRGVPEHRGNRELMLRIFAALDSESDRALCRLLLECDMNLSEAARRLTVLRDAARCGFENPPSTKSIKFRLERLAPKLVAAGLGPTDWRSSNAR